MNERSHSTEPAGLHPFSDPGSGLPASVTDDPFISIAVDLSILAWDRMVEWSASVGAHLDVSAVDTKTSPNDLVTLGDKQIESLVRGYLAQARPDDLMVGEEGAPRLDPAEFFGPDFLETLAHGNSAAGTIERVASPVDVPAGGRVEWHVDPIDGTVNFVRGIEHHAFSVGVCVRAADGSEEWIAGLVASPGLDATWIGLRGEGSYRVEGRLSREVLDSALDSALDSGGSSSTVRRLGGTPQGLSGRILATGFAYTGNNRAPQLAKLIDLMDGYDDIRRCGSAAIDLCMVAEGRINAYAERGLGVYDYAAGAVIAEEAGIRVHRGGSGGGTAAAETVAELERLVSII